MEKDFTNTAYRAVKNWWVSLIIGILSVGLGVIFIIEPFDALVTLSLLFVAGFIISGISEIIFAISNKDVITGWGWTLTSGIIDILIAIMLISIPTSTSLMMVYFIGFWIMFQSVWGIGMASDLQRMGVKDWWWFLLLAILGVIFSFIFILSPVFASGFIVAIAAVAFIIYGIFRIYLSLKFRSFKNKVREVME